MWDTTLGFQKLFSATEKYQEGPKQREACSHQAESMINQDTPRMLHSEGYISTDGKNQRKLHYSPNMKKIEKFSKEDLLLKKNQ